MASKVFVDDARRVYCASYSGYAQWNDIVAEQRAFEHDREAVVVEGGILEPMRNGLGGVSTADFRFVAACQTRDRIVDPSPARSQSYGAYKVGPSELSYCDEDVIFGGVFSGHFGHMVLDGFSRLWWKVAHPEDTRRYVFIVRTHKPFQNQFLELLGLSEEQVMFVTSPTRFRSILVPADAYHSWGRTYHPVHAIEPFRRIAERAMELSHVERQERIYLTRSRLQGRRGLFGEKYFEDFYGAHGYSIVAPETLPLVDQIALVASAKDVVCTMGTLAHTALFASEGTRYTYLISHNKKLLEPQGWIDRCAGTDWRMVDVSQNFLMPVVPKGPVLIGPALIGPTASFAAYVKDVFGEEVDERLSDDALDFMDGWIRYNTEHYWRPFGWTAFDLMNTLSEVSRGEALDEHWLEQAILLNMEDRIKKAHRFVEGHAAVGGSRPRRNILPYPYQEKTTVKNGIEWTDLGDGRIDLHGTATKATEFTLTVTMDRSEMKTGQQKFAVSLGASGGGNNTFYLSGFIGNKDGEGLLLRNAAIASSAFFGSMFVIDTTGYEYFGKLYLVVKEGVSFNHKVIEPMICPADLWDGTWEAYRPEEDSEDENLSDFWA